MTMLKYPGDFDFAYKGFQYPIPPSWKYAIRLEDQIQWLLQALLKINDEAVSQSILEAGLADTLEQAKEYTDTLNKALSSKVNANYEDLSDQIKALAAGISQWLSPVCDGNNQYAPYIDQQLFNAARPYAASYDEVVSWGTEKEYTYDQVKTALSSYTQYQLCMYGAVIFAGVTYGNYEQVLQRCKPYPVKQWEEMQPKYPSVINTYGELDQYGALTYKGV